MLVKKQAPLSDSYFSKLYKHKTVEFSENIKQGTLVIDPDIDISSYLNRDLTEKEILDSASHLKSGRATGLDRKFLKHGRHVLVTV